MRNNNGPKTLPWGKPLVTYRLIIKRLTIKETVIKVIIFHVGIFFLFKHMRAKRLTPMPPVSRLCFMFMFFNSFRHFAGLHFVFPDATWVGVSVLWFFALCVGVACRRCRCFAENCIINFVLRSIYFQKSSAIPSELVVVLIQVSQQWRRTVQNSEIHCENLNWFFLASRVVIFF